RSVVQALALEQQVGKKRYLMLSGNRPIPGGISATTWAWYHQNERALLKKADLVGHLNTFIHLQMTGSRVVDPSNASFMGVYLTTTQGGWSYELCEAVKLPMALLPEVHEANAIAGHATAQAARAFGITAGTPVMTGIVDTSSAMLLSGANIGQFANNC